MDPVKPCLMLWLLRENDVEKDYGITQAKAALPLSSGRSIIFFLYRNFYFCTGIYISVLGYIYCTEEYSRTTNEYVCSGTYVFVLRD